MFIRLKDGFYAGTIREFPPHIAKQLIAAGRAENPFNRIEDPPEERAPVKVAADRSPARKRSR